MKKDKKTIAKYILTLVTFAWMIMIFSLSAVHSTESNKVTVKDAGVLSELFVPGYKEKNIREQIDITAGVHHLLRKAAHAIEFAVLGFLFVVDIYLWFAPGKIILVLMSLIPGCLYAASDEIHQYYVPGRSCELGDVIIDSVGVAAGVICAMIVIFIVKRISEKRQHES